MSSDSPVAAKLLSFSRRLCEFNSAQFGAILLGSSLLFFTQILAPAIEGRDALDETLASTQQQVEIRKKELADGKNLSNALKFDEFIQWIQYRKNAQHRDLKEFRLDLFLESPQQGIDS